MDTIVKPRYLILLLSSVLLISGCTSTTANKENYSGFLKDYSQLQEVELADGEPTLRWISPALQKHKYQKVFIDPVVVYPPPQSSAQVDAGLITDAASYLEQSIAQQLRGAGMQVVSGPEADTLRLRAAITAVESKAEGFKAYEVIPIAAIVAGVTAAAGTRDRNVEAFMEVELTDINSGEVLALAVKKGIGEETLENEKTKVGMAQLKPTLDRWAKEAGAFAETLLK